MINKMHHIIYLIIGNNSNKNRELVYSISSLNAMANDDFEKNVSIYVYTDSKVILPEEFSKFPIFLNQIDPEEKKYWISKFNMSEGGLKFNLIQKHLIKGAHVLFLDTKTVFTGNPSLVFDAMENGNNVINYQLQTLVDRYRYNAQFAGVNHNIFDLSVWGISNYRKSVVSEYPEVLESLAWDSDVLDKEALGYGKVADEELHFFSDKVILAYSSLPEFMYLVALTLKVSFKNDFQFLNNIMPSGCDQAELNLDQLHDLYVHTWHKVGKLDKCLELYPKSSHVGSKVRKSFPEPGLDSVPLKIVETDLLPDIPGTRKPKVSCLCLTENRPLLLKRAIGYFLDQSYENKEMVIVFKEDDINTFQFLKSVSHNNIKKVKVPSGAQMSLGERRNLSIMEASGDYCIQWDDDDWYHNKRIEWQMNAVELLKKPAAALMNTIIYDSTEKQAYFSFGRAWENTILFDRSLIMNNNYLYPALNKSEDTGFMQRLLDNKMVAPVDCPPAYIYVCHNTNTWNRDHFKRIFSYSQKLSKFASELVRDTVEGKLSNLRASKRFSSRLFMSELDYFYAPDKEQELEPAVYKINQPA